MSLKEANRVKNVLGNTQFELEAQADESFRVKAIRVYNPSSNYATIRVNRVTSGYFRCGGNLGSHINFPLQDFDQPNLFEWLVQQGMFSPIPIPTGMKMTIEGVHQAGSIVTVIYDVFDANDVRATETNGPESKNYDFIQYCRYSGTLAEGENLYTVQQSPATYPKFPLENAVKPNQVLTLLGMAFSDYGNTTGTQANQQGTRYVKLVKDRTVLMDDDLNGLLYEGIISTSADETNIGEGYSMAGNHSSVDQRKILTFEPSLRFVEGDDIDLYVTTVLDAGVANIAAADAEVALMFNVQHT